MPEVGRCYLSERCRMVENPYFDDDSYIDIEGEDMEIYHTIRNNIGDITRKCHIFGALMCSDIFKNLSTKKQNEYYAKYLLLIKNIVSNEIEINYNHYSKFNCVKLYAPINTSSNYIVHNFYKLSLKESKDCFFHECTNKADNIIYAGQNVFLIIR